ncbi:MAG: outer membrane protein assembly factor BamA [Lentisphaeria bacterium]|nr:outer membrane protein assembly factor BamA [Lentisphaeria bacterium]
MKLFIDHYRVVLLFALLASGTVLTAAKVELVEFDQKGSSPISEELLKHNVRLRKGITFTREIMDEDIRSLYRTGNFSDVQGVTDYISRDKVNIKFLLRLKERIAAIKIEGNKKFSKGDLGKLITVAEGGLLNSAELRKSSAALRKFYHDRGYRDAVITPLFIPQGNDTVVIFKIDEKLRLKVGEVTFEGAKVFSQFELRHSIANAYSFMNYLPFLNDYLNMGLLDRRELTTDRARLREKYYEKGYLDFKIKDVIQTPDPKDPEYVNILFKLEEGKPYTVGKVTVSGNKVFKNEVISKYLKIKEKDLFVLSRETASANAVTRLYETIGHAEVNCRAVRIPDPEKHIVDLRFEVSEGRKFMVRDVIISGNTATRDKVIRRELAIQPGDPVDRNRIEISRQRLLGMGYFTKVETETVNAEGVDEKDVTFRIEEKQRRYNFRLTAGVSDINSFFGMLEASVDNFDLFNPKGGFYGGGQRARIQGILGVENAGFNIDFVEPWFMDMPLRFEASAYMNTTDYDNWEEWRVGGRFSFQRKIFDDFTSVAFGYKYDVVRVHDIDSKIKPYVKKHDLGGTSLVSQPSLMIARDTRDSLLDPTEGYNINFFTSITPEALGASATYYRMELKGSYYMSFFDKFLVAMVGARIGTVSTFGGSDEVPLFERYYLGGSNSLRGFEYRSVGPTYNKENIGGLTMLTMTAEISHAIWGPIRGAVFCDAGGSWGDSYDMDFNKFNIGAGYGFRIKVPYLNVPIRLDIAYTFMNNQKGASNKVRLHFNVGAGFSI